MLNMLDLESPVRVEVEAQDVRADGFKAVFRTWWDSKVFGCSAVWFATT
jgi:hypothetical protein